MKHGNGEEKRFIDATCIGPIFYEFSYFQCICSDTEVIMALATLDYQDIRRAVLELPPRQRLQLIKDAILTLTTDEPAGIAKFDFDKTLSELQNAFAKVAPITDELADDARFAYLMEKHGA
ncbi:MAG: hypothetical protein KDE54_24080 [Caldilineaceae bacterium]|nr:hypothetical protein [Caldilineaceae bacterium]MCB0095085.1 hypothetical protein [Caldilineaceae bacterium]